MSKSDEEQTVYSFRIQDEEGYDLIIKNETELYYRINVKDYKGIKSKDHFICGVKKGDWNFVSLEHKKGSWKDKEK